MSSFLKSFVYAIKGITAAVAGQRNLKVQVTVALLTIGAGFYFAIPAIEWCAILLTIAMVIGLVGYLVFGETPSAWTFLGAAIIAASTFYIVRREARLKAAATARSGPASP